MRVAVITTSRHVDMRVEHFKSREEAEKALIGRDYFSYENMFIVEYNTVLNPTYSREWEIEGLQ